MTDLDLLLVLSWLTPLLLAPLAFRSSSRWPVALASLPALLSVLLLPVGTRLELPWLMLGAQFQLTESGAIFLLFSAILWGIAALQIGPSLGGDPLSGRFRLFFLLSMAGNFWLIVAQDLVNFYLGFALMGLAAYGLIIHNGEVSSLRAGRVYLAMTLVAEAALFTALLLVYQHTQSLAPTPIQLVGLSDWTIALLIFSLGIKAGLVLLHVWLPLAHPAAPVPASAVLSGAMIKAALIGWMQFLPFGHQALPGWGQSLIVIGSITLLFATLVGLTQTNPKVVLAYSSVSKMGLMSALLGLALRAPEQAPVILTVVIFYAAMHGLAKGALFLGVGIRRITQGLWFLPLLSLPALVLAGAPFTAGALSKVLLGPPLAALSGETLLVEWFTHLLVLSSLGTALLMGRFLILMAAQPAHAASHPWSRLSWLVLIGLLLLMPVLLAEEFPAITDGWPVALGALLAAAIALVPPRLSNRLLGRIPAGDIIEPIGRLSAVVWRGVRQSIPAGISQSRGSLRKPIQAWPRPVESAWSDWTLAGILALFTAVAMLLLMWGGP